MRWFTQYHLEVCEGQLGIRRHHKNYVTYTKLATSSIVLVHLVIVTLVPMYDSHSTLLMMHLILIWLRECFAIRSFPPP